MRLSGKRYKNRTAINCRQNNREGSFKSEMPFLVYKISGFNVPKITCSALFRRFFWVKLNRSHTNYTLLNGVSTIMKFLRISFVICLFLSLNVSAVDNSFKLDFDGDGRTDIALYREGSRSAQLAPQPSYW